MTVIDKEKVQQELLHAMSRLEDEINPLLIPDGGIRLAYAIPGARSPDGVGCVILPLDFKPCDERAVTITFGSTCQIVRIILTALRFSSEIRCAFEIRYSDSLIPICEDMLLETCVCDAAKIPPGLSTMDWAVAFCSEQESGVPDLICVRNKKTMTSHARLFGENPILVATNLLKISQRIIDATH